MHVLLMGLGELLLGGAAVLLWLRHHLRVSADRWARRQRRWRKRFDTVRARLTGRRAFPRWRRWRGGHNRTPTEVEERVCRLAVERKDLGLRGLSVLFARVEGVVLGVTTVRASSSAGGHCWRSWRSRGRRGGESVSLGQTSCGAST